MFLCVCVLGARCSVIGSGDQVMVTCGSVVKLRHEPTGYHLHSHPIKWGGGSGQQSVTSHGSEDDQGSMWIVSTVLGCTPRILMHVGIFFIATSACNAVRVRRCLLQCFFSFLHISSSSIIDVVFIFIDTAPVVSIVIVWDLENEGIAK